VAAIWQAYVSDLGERAIVATMKHTWKALASMFGPLEPRDITPDHCRRYAAQRREQGRRDGTIHTELGHLRSALLWAEKRRIIDRAPHIERPSKSPPREVYFTRAECARLIRACDAPHVRLFVILALATAARREALLTLTWDRVDFERGQIDLRDAALSRRHKGRAIVPINRTAKAALLEAQRGALTPFVIEYGGKPVASVKRGLAAAGARAGLVGVTHHALRHVAGAHMIEAGIDMELVSQYLGHSDIGVTRRVYARYSVDALRGAGAVLEYDDLGSVVPVSTSQTRGKTVAR
jgi:integrase